MCFEDRWIEWLRFVFKGFRISGVEPSVSCTGEVVY